MLAYLAARSVGLLHNAAIACLLSTAQHRLDVSTLQFVEKLSSAKHFINAKKQGSHTARHPSHEIQAYRSYATMSAQPMLAPEQQQLLSTVLATDSGAAVLT